MLTRLSVSNFALIDNLQLEPGSGFSVITGETGAGKSILLGALGLVLGKRADLGVLRDESRKCVVEAEFDLTGTSLQEFFDTHDLDFETATLVRREILPGGKSRAFINDTPVNLQQMQELGERLVDIHSQHQTLYLGQEEFQFGLLDAFAGTTGQRKEFHDRWNAYRKSVRELADLEEQIARNLKEQGYRDFLLEELTEANFREDEQSELEAELSVLDNAESLQEQLSRADALLHEEQFMIRQGLTEVRQALQKIAHVSPDYEKLANRFNQSFIELDDLGREISRLSGRVQRDPAALERISVRLQLIYDLQKKHQVPDISGLIRIRTELSEGRRNDQDQQQRKAGLEVLIAERVKELDTLAEGLHKARSAQSEKLEKELVSILTELGMPDARLSFRLEKADGFNDFGKDKLELLFSANKGMGFSPLKKVASGGEMSRIMLAIKAVMSRYSQLPTLILDEIDTGVSGEIAHKMAEIMYRMGQAMQVVSITHLPQIAAKGARHFKVFKKTEQGRAASDIVRLGEDERITEIAQMLSGSTITDSAINHARALLN